MHDYAVGPGRELSRFLDLTGRRRLLDVGGGPGTYSILLAAANPDLTCTVFDLPSVVPIAEEVIERHDLTARVSTVGGDYHSDAFPRSFDVVLVSNTLHQEDEATCKRILSQAYESLEDGGICVVHAMPMNERQDGPVWPALHNLLMLLIYRGGRAYTQGQYCELMTGAGFSDVEAHTMSVFNAGMFIVGRR
jgi:cyclopropane fatty-acyl-phospholipid synthase-like methyltransferase